MLIDSLTVLRYIYSKSLILGRELTINDLYEEFKEKVNSYIIDLKEAKYIKHVNDVITITSLGRKQFTVVLTGGAYDLLHEGHLETLEQAKKCGEILVVVIARNQVISKGKRTPIFSEAARVRMINSLSVVDACILGQLHDHIASVEIVDPDVIAIGNNQNYHIEKLNMELEARGLKVNKIVRLDANIKNLSTSELIQRIVKETK